MEERSDNQIETIQYDLAGGRKSKPVRQSKSEQPEASLARVEQSKRGSVGRELIAVGSSPERLIPNGPCCE